jgi:decaprenyl-phosphate phosphoribosyltransferase
VRIARPRQWLKNILGAAAPAAAGALFEPSITWRVALAFAVFCLASAGVYAFNDAHDVTADRQHPVKRERPVAAGDISVPLARAFGVALVVVALALSVVLGPAFGAAVALYVVLMFAYSSWLKHLAVVDLVVIASGFVIRAVAGGLATDLPLSGWFIIVASFGALFIVAGKRYTELLRLGPDSGSHRPTLELYSPAFLQHVLGMATGVTAIAYCLWAFEGADAPGAGEVWLGLSILPFVMVLLRYTLLVFAGRGGEPEDIFLPDRPLQSAAVAWALVVGAGIYLS